MSRDITFSDLAESAAAEATEAATQPEKDTGDWLAETVELLDKRGLLEPILFGPEQAAEVQQQVQEQAAEQVEQAGGMDLNAETIANTGERVMDQLGDDVTVAELVQICRDNPSLVDKKIADALGGDDE